MADKYDEAVAFLTENPDLIIDAWERDSLEGENARHQCLFDYVIPSQHGTYRRSDNQLCGCLTQIKGECAVGGVAWTDDLTDAIQEDDRIPEHQTKVTVEDLPVFAEWQRRIDKELDR